MRSPDRARRRPLNEIVIECPSQTIRISSDSYGSLLNQNISMGSNRISITQTGNGQEVRVGPSQVSAQRNVAAFGGLLL